MNDKDYLEQKRSIAILRHFKEFLPSFQKLTALPSGLIRNMDSNGKDTKLTSSRGTLCSILFVGQSGRIITPEIDK